MKQMTEQEHKAVAEFVSKIDWNNPQDANKKALATTIVEKVQEDVYNQQIVGFLADYKEFGPGEELQFKTRRGLVAYVVEPGAYAPRSAITNTVTTLPRKLITVATELELGQLRSGRYGDIADIKSQALEQILMAQNKMLWDVAWRAVTSSTQNSNYATFASTATAATKKTALDAAISYMADITPGGARAIIGRFSALSFLESSYLDTDYLSESGKEELMNRSGFMGKYKGVPVFRLESAKDGYGVQKITAAEILVIGNGVLKFGAERPGLEVFDMVKGTTNHTWELTLWYTCGAAAIETHKIYRLSVS